MVSKGQEWNGLCEYKEHKRTPLCNNCYTNCMWDHTVYNYTLMYAHTQINAGKN